MEVKQLKVILTLALITAMLISCRPASTPTSEPPTNPATVGESTSPSQDGLPRTEAEVPRVTVEEAFTAVQNGEAIIVDVRSAESYQASHAAGALSIPLGQIETDLASINLDKEQWIITDCT